MSFQSEFRSTRAAVTLWIAITFNMGVFVMDIAHDRVHAAAAQSLIVVGLTAAAVVFPKLYARIDAQLREAIAKRDTAEFMLKELQRLAQRGGLRVGLAGEVTAARPH